MSLSNYLENKVLDKIFRNTDFTVTGVYVSLHTADPGETGANEVTGGSYERQSAAFDAAVAGATQNSGLINFAGMPAVTVTHVGCWDASTAGNFIGGGSGNSRTVESGDRIEIAAGDLDVTLD